MGKARKYSTFYVCLYLYISDSDEWFEGNKAEAYDREGAGTHLEEVAKEDLNGLQEPLVQNQWKSIPAGELIELPAKNQELHCSRQRLYKSQIALLKQSNQETA